MNAIARHASDLPLTIRQNVCLKPGPCPAAVDVGHVNITIRPPNSADSDVTETAVFKDGTFAVQAWKNTNLDTAGRRAHDRRAEGQEGCDFISEDCEADSDRDGTIGYVLQARQSKDVLGGLSRWCDNQGLTVSCSCSRQTRPRGPFVPADRPRPRRSQSNAQCRE